MDDHFEVQNLILMGNLGAQVQILRLGGVDVQIVLRIMDFDDVLLVLIHEMRCVVCWVMQVHQLIPQMLLRLIDVDVPVKNLNFNSSRDISFYFFFMNFSLKF